MSTHKRITALSQRAAHELVIAAFVVRVAAAHVAGQARWVYGWSRYCSGL